MNKTGEKTPIHRPFFGELSLLSLLLIAGLFVRRLLLILSEALSSLPVFSQLSVPLFYGLAFAFLPFLYLKAKRMRPSDVLCYRGKRLKHPILTALASLTSIQLVGIAASLVITALGGDGSGAVAADAMPHDLPGILLFFVEAVCFPALFEEAFCRGLVLKTLLPYGRRKALIVSALVFGLLHATPASMIYAFFGGLIFGSITLRTGSLMGSTVLHLLQNGFSCVLMLLIRLVNTPQEQTAAGVLLCAYLLIGAVCGLVLLVLYGKEKLALHQAGKERQEICLPAGGFFASFGFWLFLLFALVPLF